MKQILKFISLPLLLLLVLTGCEKEFLNEVPTTGVAASSAVSTTDNLFLVVNGIHRLMYERQGSNGEGGYSAMMIQHDALGEDLVMNARSNGWWISMASWNDHTNATDSDNRFGWRVLYKIINNANIVIEGADEATGPDAQRKAAVGQALAYRAFAHFTLVQRHAIRYTPGGNNTQPGIPLVLTATTEGQSRATVEEVYAQINQDLDDAIANLEGYVRPNNSHIDEFVAKGLKARVNLVQGNWAVAADFAIQARADFELMSNDEYLAGFNDYSNREWMWGGFYNEEQGSLFTNFGAWMSRNFNSTNIRGNPKSISKVLHDQIPTTDVRSLVFSPDGSHPNLPAGYVIPSNFARFPYTSQKFLSFDTGDSRGDVPYMRAAEMYLIEAEAKARMGTGGAEALLPLAQNRDAAYTLSTNTGQALIDEILLQRRWELWGEGFRFFDLKRTDAALDRTGSNHVPALLGNLLQVPAGDSRWQWLIPMAEIDANPNITQNP
ncbi:RagB/SusD family nutrient uptake outer membrane protein [Neolewinella lacunae]|uniref:RagB/SusD family nutrient uptake outer membrane protein n=1 Tax=Neolewinella lacunae TaxID=1517758 RepID=A0A923PSK5_9BACT|nr:RagB/SusD family nutrient uptake outer membrane protein [Neolewinella lacunae]MBC6996724.1 RagB/SusD family nutrient uptake outer membrane protein [Neolewinella lacunae]MDN3633411.1 RagB/SusD family nutrient uptake outer membrane protein [Neolewinella lacunae]